MRSPETLNPLSSRPLPLGAREMNEAAEASVLSVAHSARPADPGNAMAFSSCAARLRSVPRLFGILASVSITATASSAASASGLDPCANANLLVLAVFADGLGDMPSPCTIPARSVLLESLYDQNASKLGEGGHWPPIRCCALAWALFGASSFSSIRRYAVADRGVGPGGRRFSANDSQRLFSIRPKPIIAFFPNTT